MELVIQRGMSEGDAVAFPAMRLIPLCLIAAILLAGCSTGSDSDATSTATEADADQFCSTFGNHAVELTGIGVGTEPSELEAAFTRLGPALDDLDAQAPASIKPQVQAVSDHLRSYGDLLRQYGWSYEQVAAEGSEEENAKLSGPGPTADLQVIIDYVTEQCPNVTIPE